jgi:outer membrane protein assembly factor BamB
VVKPQTTICCSAFALAIACAASALVAQTLPKTPPPFTFKATWTVAMNGSLAAPPTFNGARAYVPLDEDRLVAYDLNEGADVWTVKANVRSQPASGDGLVFVVENDALVALRATDGSLKWRLRFAEPLAVPLVWDNGWLIAAGTSGVVHAFRASDGNLIWQRDIGAPARARPALAADRVYLPTADRRIVALRVDTGAPLWERRLGGALNDALALDDRIYVGSDDNYLYCLKTSDGEVDWRWPTGADVIGLPAADSGLVYFVSLDNTLRGLDRKSGNQRWKRPMPLRPNVGPMKAGEWLIVSGVAPTLRAYYAKDGRPAGDVATDGELAAPPYFLDQPDGQAVIVVTRNIAKGAVLSALSRVIAPPPPPTTAPASTPTAPVPPKPQSSLREPRRPAE